MSKQAPPHPEELDTLEAERESAIANVKSDGSIYPEFVTIPGHDTPEDREHPCWKPDADAEADDALAHSLGTEGQRQEIVIRKVGSIVECIYGAGRIKAARLWNLANPTERLKLRYRKMAGATNKQLARWIVVENEHRKIVSVEHKAEQAARLMQKYGETLEDVASLFRVTEQTIESWLRILDMSPEARQAYREGAVSKADLERIQHLKPEDQTATVELARENGKSLGETAAGAGLPPKSPKAPRAPRGEGSTRPGPAEMRKAMEDNTISDVAISWREALAWAAGDRPYLTKPA